VPVGGRKGGGGSLSKKDNLGVNERKGDQTDNSAIQNAHDSLGGSVGGGGKCFGCYRWMFNRGPAKRENVWGGVRGWLQAHSKKKGTKKLVVMRVLRCRSDKR